MCAYEGISSTTIILTGMDPSAAQCFVIQDLHGTLLRPYFNRWTASLEITFWDTALKGEDGVDA